MVLFKYPRDGKKIVSSSSNRIGISSLNHKLINSDFSLLVRFSYSSKASFLSSAFRSFYLIPRLCIYLKSLQQIQITFDDSVISKLMIRHAKKRVLGIQIHSLAQAYLETGENFNIWQKHPSRRNVRKNVRKAQEHGFNLRIVPFPEIAEEVELLEIKRGGNLPGFWGNFPDNVPQNELICASVYSPDNSLMAVCIGSNTNLTAKIFAAISTSRSDGARWLAKYGIIEHYFGANVQHLLISDRIGLKEGHLEFQKYFGFESKNLNIQESR